MRITVRCAGLSVAKQSADDRQAMATGGTHRGERDGDQFRRGRVPLEVTTDCPARRHRADV